MKKINLRYLIIWIIIVGILSVGIYFIVKNIKSKNSLLGSVSMTNSSNGCDIKGNIGSSGEKIYHLKECGSYSKTKIDETGGER